MMPCTKASVLYENICAICNEGAGAKRDLERVTMDPPSVYVGEASKTIQERGLKHWTLAKGKNKEGSHIYKHQELHHGGAPPKFILRTISFHKTALSRQTTEAVRIRRRGGAGNILNSKGEFNRSHIPRLMVEDEENRKTREQIEREHNSKLQDKIEEQFGLWEQERTDRRSTDIREQLDKTGRRGKTRKLLHKIMEEDWGSENSVEQTPIPPPGAEIETAPQTKKKRDRSPTNSSIRNYFTKRGRQRSN